MSEYAERDFDTDIELGDLYVKHVSAMTDEDLHSKSAIAAELAYRDKRIAELEEEADFNSRWITQTCETGEIKAERNQNIANGHTWILSVAIDLEQSE